MENNGQLSTQEIPACDWCKGVESEPILQGPDMLMELPGTFQHVRCLNCGLIRQNPRLTWEVMENYYPENYSAYKPIIDTEKHLSTRLDRRYGMWKRLKSLERYKAGGRLLDIGCGSGIFLAEAERSSKWDLIGIEPNASAAKRAQAYLESPIIQASFSDVSLDASSFDVITMWNVLEHLESPITDIQRIYQLLKDGGLFIFSIPNLESWEAKIMGPYWIGWDLPRHLYLFPRELLNEILSTMGFTEVDYQCIAGAHAAFAHSLDFWFRSLSPKAPKARAVFQRIYLSLPSRVLFALPFWLSDRFKASSLITVFARKITGRKT